MTDPKKMLTIKELAALEWWPIKLTTTRQLISTGRLPAYRLKQKIWVKREVAQAFLEENLVRV